MGQSSLLIPTAENSRAGGDRLEYGPHLCGRQDGGKACMTLQNLGTKTATVLGSGT